MSKQPRRIAVGEPRVASTGSRKQADGRVRNGTNGQVAAKPKGPRRIADPRDVREYRQAAKNSSASANPINKGRRNSVQPSSGARVSIGNPQRIRRQSAPASVMDTDVSMLDRERRKLQHLKLAQGLDADDIVTPSKHSNGKTRHDFDQPSQLNLGRRVSFIPNVEEAILSPLKEED